MSSNIVLGHRERVVRHIEQSQWAVKLTYVLGFAILTALLAQVRVYAPWNPYVPYTGQVLGVVGSGLVLGTGLGAASMALYLLLGALGLPVFADWSGGAEVFLGATAGYLFAFPIAAGLTGLASRRYVRAPGERTLVRLGLAALAGIVLLFDLGALLLGPSAVLATEGLGLTVLVSSTLVVGLGVLLWVWSRDEATAFLARMAAGLLGVLVVYLIGWVVLHLVTGMGWAEALAVGVIQFIPVDIAKVFVAAGAAGLVVPPRLDARVEE